MTHESVNIVLAEALHEGQRLRVVGAQGVGVAFLQTAVVARARTLKRVGIDALLSSVVVYVARDVELQPVGEADVGDECAVELVHTEVVGVVQVGAEGVTCCHERTCHAVAGGHTIVVTLVTILVCSDVGLAVVAHLTDVDGVDGSDACSKIHDVGRTHLLVEVRARLGVRVDILCVDAELQPLLCLVVGLGACADALVA